MLDPNIASPYICLSDSELSSLLKDINSQIKISSEPLKLVSELPYPSLFNELVSSRSQETIDSIHSLFTTIFSIVDLEKFCSDYKV